MTSKCAIDKSQKEKYEKSRENIMVRIDSIRQYILKNFDINKDITNPTLKSIVILYNNLLSQLNSYPRTIDLCCPENSTTTTIGNKIICSCLDGYFPYYDRQFKLGCNKNYGCVSSGKTSGIETGYIDSSRKSLICDCKNNRIWNNFYKKCI